MDNSIQGLMNGGADTTPRENSNAPKLDSGAGDQKIWGAVISAAATIAATIYQNVQNKKNNEQAAKLNYEYGEKTAENADARGRKLYEDLNSPGAKARQLQEAGLSLGLMYGNSGGSGGTSAGTGAQGTGSGNQQGKQAAVFDLSNASIASEIELNKALAKKAEADAKKTAGVDTENTEADTAVKNISVENIIKDMEVKDADIKVKEAQAELLELQKGFDEIRNQVQISTAQAQINTYMQQLEKMKEETNKIIADTQNSSLDAEIKEKSKEAQIQYYNENLKNIVADTLLKQVQGRATEEQINKTLAEIDEIIKRTSGEHGQQVIDRERLETELEKAGIMKSAMLWSAGISGGTQIIKVLLDYGTLFTPGGAAKALAK